MASKTISKTDVSKKAVVVTEPFRTLLRPYGNAHLRGDGLISTHVNVVLTNTGENIQLHYYGSERLGADRTPEERCWHESFNDLLAAGKTFELVLRKGQLELTIS